MELFIYTERPAGHVKPGDLIDHPKGPMVVDETRSNIIGVDIYGRTPGVDAGPRRRLHLTFDDTARVLPDYSTLHTVWSMVMYAISHYEAPSKASAATELAQLVAPAVQPEEDGLRAWLGGSAPGQLVVRMGDEIWYVEPQYPVPAPAKPDDEASPDA